MIDVLLPNTAEIEAPAVLLPYQRAWIELDAQLKIGEKSRRIGLTWAEAADNALIAAAAKAAGGQNVYYIGYNQDMALEYIQAVGMWARAYNYAASEIEEGIWEDGKEDRNIKTYTISFPDSGHRVVALSSRPANLRGKQGVVVIDEAAFHDALDELIKAALALLIWGGRVRILSTHNGITNPFNLLILEVRQLQRKGAVFKCTFKEAVSQGLYRRVCLRLGKDWSQAEEDTWMKDVYSFYGDDALEELDVIPSQSSGTYFPAVLVETRMSKEIPLIELGRSAEWGLKPVELRAIEIREWCDEHLLPILIRLDPKREHCFGEDFARSGDLTILNPAVIEQTLTRRILFQLELRNIPFAQQREIIYYILDRLPRLRGAAFDSRGNGQQIAEEAGDKYGHGLIHKVMASRGWYAEFFPLLKKAYEDDAILAPKHASVSGDLRAVKVNKGVPGLPEGKTNEKGQAQRHGDSAIAQVMMWFASLQEPAEYAYHPVRRSDEQPRPIRTTAGLGRGKGLW
jgi:phage FluMu gp28-like protein